MLLLKRYFQEKPVELIVGLGLLLLSFVLTAVASIPEKIHLQVILNAVSSCSAAFAALLISWSCADVRSREKAVLILKPELEGLSLNLGSVSFEIKKLVAKAQLREVDTETAHECLRLLTTQLYLFHTGFQKLIGDKFDPEPMVENRQLLDQIGRVEKVAEASERAGLMTPELAEELDQLKELAEWHNQELVTVTCPNPSCDHRGQHMIGPNPGDSRTTRCVQCETRFHIHRNSSGDIFTKRWGEGSRTSEPGKKWVSNVECPSCNHVISARLDRTSKENDHRYCMKCFADLEICPTSGQVVDWRHARPIDADLMQTGELRCPDCKAESKVIFTDHEKHSEYAVCFSCKNLLRHSDGVEEAKSPALLHTPPSEEARLSSSKQGRDGTQTPDATSQNSSSLRPETDHLTVSSHDRPVTPVDVAESSLEQRTEEAMVDEPTAASIPDPPPVVAAFPIDGSTVPRDGQIEFHCPGCGFAFQLPQWPSGTKLHNKYCLVCPRRIEYDPHTGTIVSHRKTKGLLGKQTGENSLECPMCVRDARIVHSQDGLHFAVCFKCDVLLTNDCHTG